jgi:hypothetical protein
MGEAGRGRRKNSGRAGALVVMMLLQATIKHMITLRVGKFSKGDHI